MPHYMESLYGDKFPTPGDILKHICILDYRAIIAAVVAILGFKLESPRIAPHCLVEMPNVSIPHIVRTLQAAKRAANLQQCPTCPEMVRVGIHFDWCKRIKFIRMLRLKC